MMKLLSTGLLVLILASSGAFAKEGDPDDGHEHNFKNFYRLDCRYHNVEHNHGANFCYASAIYRFEDSRFSDIHLGVGCDNQTIFYDKSRLHEETTLDRLSPLRAATPGVEVFPQGQLGTEGTYTSELDISLGRFQGLCYVHRIMHP